MGRKVVSYVVCTYICILNRIEPDALSLSSDSLAPILLCPCCKNAWVPSVSQSKRRRRTANPPPFHHFERKDVYSYIHLMTFLQPSQRQLLPGYYFLRPGYVLVHVDEGWSVQPSGRRRGSRKPVQRLQCHFIASGVNFGWFYRRLVTNGRMTLWMTTWIQYQLTLL